MNMLVNERPLPRKLSIQLPLPGEMALLTTVAIAFLILHVLAGTLLLKAPASAAVTPQQQEEARPGSHD